MISLISISVNLKSNYFFVLRLDDDTLSFDAMSMLPKKLNHTFGFYLKTEPKRPHLRVIATTQHFIGME